MWRQLLVRIDNRAPCCNKIVADASRYGCGLLLWRPERRRPILHGLLETERRSTKNRRDVIRFGAKRQSGRTTARQETRCGLRIPKKWKTQGNNPSSGTVWGRNVEIADLGNVSFKSRKNTPSRNQCANNGHTTGATHQ